MWSPQSLPDLSGRKIVITGANSGIGWEAALMLADRGAAVTLACRHLGRAGEAMDRIRAACPSADLDSVALDLADLDSVRRCATELAGRLPSIDVLINNAGVMAIPYRTTADGFEMQFGTNHLGHFALTGLLLPNLLAAPAARVVNVSSQAHRFGSMRWDDLQWQRGYQKWLAYGQSKLANLLFTFGLQRRLGAANQRAISVACHPGYADTNLQSVGAKMSASRIKEKFMRVANRVLAQSSRDGALPTVYAAGAPDVSGGDYIGPEGFMQQRGSPVVVRARDAAYDETDQDRLWRVSEELTSVEYAGLGG